MNEVRDSRPRDFAWFDNRIIDQYAPIIGIYALGVYMALVKCADSSSQQCYPSLRWLEKTLGTGRKQIVAALKTLEQHGLISKESRTSSAGDAETNIYTILSPWKSNEGGIPETPPGIPETPPGIPETPQVVSERNWGGFPEKHRTKPIEQNPKKRTSPTPSSDSLDEGNQQSQEWPSAQAFIAWWNETIVPLGGRCFESNDADDKLLTKINKALKAKSSRDFWDRVRLGFMRSRFLRGEIKPRDGKKRFKASLVWLFTGHYQKHTANYVLVASGEWDDEIQPTDQPRKLEVVL